MVKSVRPLPPEPAVQSISAVLEVWVELLPRDLPP